MIKFYIKRRKSSYHYKYDETKNDFANNTRNMYQDSIEIKQDDRQIFACACQTVANHPDGTAQESIAAGKFQVKLFVEQRQYANPVHLIMNAKDLEGEQIDSNGMQYDKGDKEWVGRNLIHDDCNAKTGRPYTAPWSKSCIMIRTGSFQVFNETLLELGGKPGMVIEAELIEV